MKALVIADPLSGLKLESDTSLSIARSLFAKGFDVYFCTADALFYENLSLEVRGRKVVDFKKAKAPKTGPLEKISISDFQFVLIRKDPPFDQSYVKLCWDLLPFENHIR